ncbi:ATPase, T2SS/T4P/T4SS family [Planctomycetota bacterium]
MNQGNSSKSSGKSNGALSDSEQGLSVTEAAKMLGISRSTLNRWLKEGRIKGFKVGKQWRFSRDSLRAVIDIGGREADLREESLLQGIKKIEKAILKSGLSKKDLNAKLEKMGSVEPTGDTTAILRRFMQMLLIMVGTVQASDLHLEVEIDHGLIRYRQDGQLNELARFSIPAYKLLLNEFKTMGGMDIAERKLPQHGRAKFEILGSKIDFRLATYPSLHGEGITARILDAEPVYNFLHDFDNMIGDAAIAKQIRDMLQTPSGMIVLAGPAGTGKTTLAYGMLLKLATPECKIMTIEDPVEFDLDGITQSAVNPAIGYSMAKALKAMMYNAPNTIMCANIENKAVLDLLFQFSMTGHKVLTTMPAADTVSALHQMLDMGVQASEIVYGLQAIISQRLVRRLCDSCKKAYRPAKVELRSLGLADGKDGLQFYQPKGCRQCGNSGFKGRFPVIEVLRVETDIADAVFDYGNPAGIKEELGKSGWKSMFQIGVERVLNGDTTPQEILRSQIL